MDGQETGIEEITPLEESIKSQEMGISELRGLIGELGMRLSSIRTSTPKTADQGEGVAQTDNRKVVMIREKINLNTNQIGHAIRNVKEIISELDI